MLKNTLLTLVSTLLCLLVLEGLLRFLPVNEGLRTQPVNEANPIIHFEPNRTSTWSRLPDFSMKNEVHSNNYGFINDQDYDPEGEQPLLAVIGDSYVEAAMVPYEQTIHGRLAEALHGKWRVYSFGVSGAPMSQYLAFARFVREEFRAQKMIFVIVGNDFDESLLDYKQSPGFHYFVQAPDGRLALQLREYKPSVAWSLLRHSRLTMYLAVNTRALTTFRSLFSKDADTEYVGQTLAASGEHRIRDSKLAVSEFLRMLPEYAGLPPEDITFVVDGYRPHLYDDDLMAKAKGSYFDIMRTFFLRQARSLGFQAVDMTPVFIADYRKRGRRFEYPQDGHWNENGHAVAANATLHSARLGSQN